MKTRRKYERKYTSIQQVVDKDFYLFLFFSLSQMREKLNKWLGNKYHYFSKKGKITWAWCSQRKRKWDLSWTVNKIYPKKRVKGKQPNNMRVERKNRSKTFFFFLTQFHFLTQAGPALFCFISLFLFIYSLGPGIWTSNYFYRKFFYLIYFLE